LDGVVEKACKLAVGRIAQLIYVENLKILKTHSIDKKGQYDTVLGIFRLLEIRNEESRVGFWFMFI